MIILLPLYPDFKKTSNKCSCPLSSFVKKLFVPIACTLEQTVCMNQYFIKGVHSLLLDRSHTTLLLLIRYGRLSQYLANVLDSSFLLMSASVLDDAKSKQRQSLIS